MKSLILATIVAVAACGCAPSEQSTQASTNPTGESATTPATTTSSETSTPTTETKTEGDASVSSPTTTEPTTPEATADQPKKGDEVAVMTTNLGKIVLMFFPDKAPNHVANFKKLSREGFYKGTKFHRVIPGFMIQGGDPNSKDGDRSNDGMGNAKGFLKAEFNDIKHVRGVLSMARSQDPDSASCQFFIMVADKTHLDGQYSAFGKVVSGMDVVDKIVNLERDAADNPLPKNPAIIEKIEIVKWPIK